MSDPMKQAWNEVGEGFSALGRMMKERYEGEGHPDDVDDVDDAGEDGRPGERAGAALRAAVEQLVAAGRELGERASDVARDDEVKAQAKRAAAQLNDAISATVDLIGEQVGGLFGRARVEESSTPGSATDATSTDATPGPPSSATDVPRSAPPSDDARQ